MDFTPCEPSLLSSSSSMGRIPHWTAASLKAAGVIRTCIAASMRAWGTDASAPTSSTNTSTGLSPPLRLRYSSIASFMIISATDIDSMTMLLLMRGFVPPDSLLFSAALTIASCRLCLIMCDMIGYLYLSLPTQGRSCSYI